MICLRFQKETKWIRLKEKTLILHFKPPVSNEDQTNMPLKRVFIFYTSSFKGGPNGYAPKKSIYTLCI